MSTSLLGKTYRGKPYRSKKTGEWRRRTYYFGQEWFNQLNHMIVRGTGPTCMAEWAKLVEDGAVHLHVLSPTTTTQSHCWSKRWATELEAKLQGRFMPTSVRRLALHTMHGCRSFTSGPGITGMTSATPEFFKRYPNTRFEFKKGNAKGSYAYRNGALELVG